MDGVALRRRWLGLIFMCVAVAPVALDVTLLTLALPTIADDLPIASAQVWWVQQSYPLTLAVALVGFTAITGRTNLRNLLLLGIGVFTLGSVLGGQALNSELLILARTIQGVGGGMILPATLAFVNVTFRGRDRTVAFACWGAVIAGMAALGPVLGEWMTADFAWRWGFCLNIAFGLTAVLGILRTVSHVADPEPRRFDFLAVRSFRGGAVSSLLAALGEAGVLLALPLWLVNGYGVDAIEAGILLLPLAIGAFLGIPVAAGLAGRWSPVQLARVGLGIQIATFAWLAAVLGPSASWLVLAAPLLFGGTGLALTIAQLTETALDDVPVERSGTAGGVLGSVRVLGWVLGGIVLTAAPSPLLAAGALTLALLTTLALRPSAIRQEA